MDKNAVKEKVKDHWVLNRENYIRTGIAVGSLAIGFAFARKTTPIMRDRYEALAIAAPMDQKAAETLITMRPFSFFSNQSNVVTVLERAGRGHPGYFVRCLDTGEVFSSQRAAAQAFEISETILSKHLAKKLPHAKGYTFERLAMAA